MEKPTSQNGNQLIAGASRIRQAYRDEAVAAQYIAQRFVEPLGAALHQEQVARMREVIARANPERVLEIAPGPARLSADLANDLRGRETLMDASAEMLAHARRRLADRGGSPPPLVQADAFNLPFSGIFDLVYSFRLIRHFDAGDRRRLYAQIAAALRPGGVLVFDAINVEVAQVMRRRDPTACRHYDALLTQEQLVEELSAAGFVVTQLDPVQRRYPLLYQVQVLVRPRSAALARAAIGLVQRIPGGEPLEWIVTCHRR